MKPEVGETYLLTTNDWFVAPDGESYKAVFGTVHGILTDKDTLGVATNRHSSNWYVSIGNMLVAGCQIHYCIKTDKVRTTPPARDIEHNGTLTAHRESTSRIYIAD